MLRRVVLYIFINDLEELTASLIALMMAAVSFSETSVSIYQTTRRNTSEDSHLNTCRCKNLKFLHFFDYIFSSSRLTSAYRLKISSETVTFKCSVGPLGTGGRLVVKSCM
jgi:hypothetical protein